MEFTPNENYSDRGLDDSKSLRDFFEEYTAHAKWFVISILIFAGLSYLYLRKKAPKYEISSTILVKEKEEGSSVGGLEAFDDLGIFGSNKDGLENELHILTSRRLMREVITELKLNVKYFIEESPYNIEYYPNFPIIINFSKDSWDIINYGSEEVSNKSLFNIVVISNSKFEYFDESENSLGIKNFGEEFESDFGRITISPNELWESDLINKSIIVSISSIDDLIDRYSNNLIVETLDEKSRVVKLSIKESVQEKGIAIINNLIEQYNTDAIEDKNVVHKKTTEFLNDRLILITSELNAIENTVQQFKTQKGLIEPNAGAGIFLESSSANENRLIDANTQLQMVNFMLSELNSNNYNDPLPVNIGLSDESVLDLIGGYNELILQRNRILKSSTVKNPLVVNIDSQIIVLKNNLNSSLNTTLSSLQIQINSLNVQSGKLNSRIASVPKNEKDYKDIVRQLETKNAVYLFLLQKREESILSNAITIDKARVIDSAYTNGVPVSPKPSLTYLGAILFGLLLPTGIIYMKGLMDTKVHGQKDVEGLKIPYLGDVPFANVKSQFIKDGDNSNVAEAFRYVRTNISFMLDGNKNGKVIFVTSTQSHEGKTFTAINLSKSLAISGKKVLLIGMDLRAPKISEYLGHEDIMGVSNFVKEDSLSFQSILEKRTNFENLHIINSGDIPPNPVELLMSKRIEELFKFSKETYEYVIVDSAPVGMVTDTIQISKYADLTIYVIKAGSLDKRMLHIPYSLNRESKLKNMAVLINGTNQSKGAYGYGYGYGKDKKKKKWFSRTA